MRIEGVLATAAVVPFAMAIVVVVVGLLRLPGSGRDAPAELAAALALALELLLAAGLLRLAAIQDVERLAAVAAIVLLRRLLGTGIRYALRALGVEQVAGLRA